MAYVPARSSTWLLTPSKSTIRVSANRHTSDSGKPSLVLSTVRAARSRAVGLIRLVGNFPRSTYFAFLVIGASVATDRHRVKKFIAFVFYSKHRKGYAQALR